MYEVIIRKNGKEKISEPMSWAEAYASYDEQSKTINATDEKGTYLHPENRLSIHKLD